MKKKVISILTIILLFPTAELATSCSKNDEKTITSEKSEITRLNDNDIAKISNLLLTSQKTTSTSRIVQGNLSPLTTVQTNSSPLVAYVSLMNSQNIKIDMAAGLEVVMDNSYEQNIQLLKNKNLISEQEIKISDNFKNQLINTSNFNLSISNFETSIKKLPLSTIKLQKYMAIIDGLKVLNTSYPDYFSNKLQPGDPFFGSCASASVGLGIAFVGLATIEVGSFGLATGIAVGGFLWASAEWGAACGGKSGKRMIKAPLIRPYNNGKEQKDSWLTPDGDEDLKPIIVKFTY
jgi:hypothetical protein